MDKEEVKRLHEELNELSALEGQNLERMVEIAKILNAYYMWWRTENKSNAKTAESELRWKCEENCALNALTKNIENLKQH